MRCFHLVLFFLSSPSSSSSCFCLFWALDVESCRGRGPHGEGGLCWCDHHEQTQGPERPQLQHGPTDLPSAEGVWKEPLGRGHEMPRPSDRVQGSSVAAVTDCSRSPACVCVWPGQRSHVVAEASLALAHICSRTLKITLLSRFNANCFTTDVKASRLVFGHFSVFHFSSDRKASSKSSQWSTSYQKLRWWWLLMVGGSFFFSSITVLFFFFGECRHGKMTKRRPSSSSREQVEKPFVQVETSEVSSCGVCTCAFCLYCSKMLSK